MSERSSTEARWVQDASLILKPETIHGLIGANGSGKTTLLALIAGLLFPDSGTITYGGMPVHENPSVLSSICMVKTYERLWNEYSLKQIYSYASLFYPYWDATLAEDLMNKFQLGGSKKYKQLSRGGQSMAGIIKGLASRAPMTLLDEPVLGLDASMREIFYRILLEDYGKYPRTFVISTHLIDEAENLFEQIAYVKKGTIAYNGPVEEFAAKASYATGPAAVLEKLSGDVRTCTLNGWAASLCWHWKTSQIRLNAEHCRNKVWSCLQSPAKAVRVYDT